MNGCAASSLPRKGKLEKMSALVPSDVAHEASNVARDASSDELHTEFPSFSEFALMPMCGSTLFFLSRRHGIRNSRVMFDIEPRCASPRCCLRRSVPPNIPCCRNDAITHQKASEPDERVSHNRASTGDPLVCRQHELGSGRYSPKYFVNLNTS